jgi:tRNA/tmRNA/rRNA uracil-C5-methylase (TrmA/RlmC/RlmD family)
VVFVRHALPGELVRARVTEVTSALARAEAVEILDASPDRVEPPCPSARPGGCGGCDWQHATLPAQRALKAAVVSEQLRRLAGVDRAVTVEALPPDGQDAGPAAAGEDAAGEDATSGEEAAGLGWRTRVQFAVGPDGLAGLRAHRSHEVIDIGDCLIAHPGLRDLGIPRRRWPGATSVEAAVAPAIPAEPGDPAAAGWPDAGGAEAGGADAGGADAGGAAGVPETAVIVVRGGHERRGRERPGRGGPGTGREAAPGRGRTREEAAIQEQVAGLPAGSVLARDGRKLTPVRGRPYLTQRAAGRDWRVSAGAFWQVHPAAADTLTAAVLAALEPKPGDSVLDLYCGAGLFAGALAAAVGPQGTVIGLESDEAAVRDARHNLREYRWARVHRGDVATAARAAGGRGRESGQAGLPPARLVVADPPRTGLDRAVIGYLSAGESGVERFAYVSCDPATLARDIGLLLARGWSLDGLRAFDAFPMTHHVECVAVLAR